tara:strand:- start:520 stop:738 length:219 start_codon:yes stop_codon:yes gene_type:complete
MNYSTGSKISILDSKGRTYTGTVLQIFENLSIFDPELPKAKGFILAVGGVDRVIPPYDIIGYDSQVTEVLCK